MCLIGIRIDRQQGLLIAANRDEFADRPTQAMHWWDNEPVLAGKDLRAGGTWLGITRNGRFAAVTNVRDPSLADAPIPMESRGRLVAAFLRGSMPAQEFIASLHSAISQPSSFNLLLGHVTDGVPQVHWYGARVRRSVSLSEGVYALSNAELDTPWPKAERLRQALTRGDRAHIEEMLASEQQAEDAHLPITGVSLAWEKKLSAAKITGADYHTRSSTFLSVRDGEVQAHEVTWAPDGSRQTEVRERFCLALPEEAASFSD